MTEIQLEAHKRLLTILPVRSHVFLSAPVVSRGGGRFPREKTHRLRDRARALHANGWTASRISKRLRITRQTVYNYVK